MKAIFEFKCENCGETHERFVYSELKESICGCGKMANKIISYPAYFKVDGFRAGINGDKWAKTREDNARRKAKQDYE